MIVQVYNCDGGRSMSTQGCGCCSLDLFEDTDDKEMIKHSIENVEVLQDICDYFGIDRDENLTNIKNQLMDKKEIT